MKLRLFFLWIVYLSLFRLVVAQQYNFQNFSLEDGLPQSQVGTLCQDKRGDLWLGTELGGVCRFNGKSFYAFLPNNQPLNYVRKIIEDRTGHLWFISDTLITVYNGHIVKEYNKKFLFQDTSPDWKLIRAFEDKKIPGKIWLLFANASLKKHSIYYLYQGKKNDFTQSYPEQLLNKGDLDLFIDQSGNLYISNQQILYQYDGSNLLTSPLMKLPLLANQKFLFVFEDSQKRIWLKMQKDKAENIYLVKDKKVEKMTLPLAAYALKQISNFYEDSQKNIWITTTASGVLKYDNRNFKWFNTTNGLFTNNITTLLEDRENNIWLGTDGGGLIKFAGDFIHFGEKDGIKDFVWSVLMSNKGDYWFGTHKKGLSKWDGKKITNYLEDANLNRVKRIVEINNNNLLLATYSGLWAYTPVLNQLKNVSKKYGLDENTQIFHLMKENNNLWLCTRELGAVRYDSAGKIQYFNQKTGLEGGGVTYVYRDSQNRIWFCTLTTLACLENGKLSNFGTRDKVKPIFHRQFTEDKSGNFWVATAEGLGKISYQQGKFSIVYLGRKEGISSEIVYSVLTDPSGNIWAGTQSGVDEITVDQKGVITKIKNYHTKEGFIGVENNTAANYVDKYGNLWLGTIKGVMMIHLGEDKKSQNPPSSHLTGIKLFLKEVDWRGQNLRAYHKGLTPWFPLPILLKLPYKNNHLTFTFEGIHLQAPEKLNFQWKLNGYDEEWSPLTKLNEAVYSNLPPGNYTFEVKAVTSDGLESKQAASIQFEILTPFWQTWWFRILALLLVSGLVYSLFRARINQLKEQKRKLEKLVEQKTQEIRQKHDEILVQNEELHQQQEEITAQRDAIEKKNKMLHDQNHLIKNSINAAKTIQQAILPFSSRLKQTLGDYVLIYRPRDIVSGDFFWLEQNSHKTFLIVADCTGHGVPGAFMSMIGNFLLNQIVLVDKVEDTAEILNQLHQQIHYALDQKNTNNHNGMDVAVLAFEKKESGDYLLSFSGAKRPLYYIPAYEQTMKVLHGDRKSIGGIQNEEKQFTAKQFELPSGSLIYMFTDGYVDQNNLHRKKLGEEKLQSLLLSLYSQPFDQQHQVLEETLDKHIGNSVQRDDILLIGFKLP